MAKNQLGQTFVTVQVEKRQFDAAMKQIVRQSVQANTRVNRNLNFRANVGGIGRLNRGLRTSGTLVKGMAGGMAAFGAAVAGATAAIVGLKALQGASGFMRSMVESGFNFNAQMERLSSVFTLLLGNIEASSRMMQQLVKFSQETPLQLPDIARAGVMLLTTKQIAENELLPTLRIIGDAAAASAEGFDAFPRIIRAISQMLAKGKIRAEEMNRQLAEIGIDVWGILAERIGKSKDELIAMAERGELGLKEIQILITGMGEDFKGFGKTASQLFLGLTSTVRDKLAIAMGEVVEPLFEMSTISLLNLKDWMDTPRAAAFVGTLQDGMRGVGDAFRDIDFKDDILPAIESMAGLFKDMAPIFKLMVDSFQVVARLSEGILDTMRQTAQFLGGALQGSQMEFQRSFDAQMRGQGGQGRTVHGRTLSKSREEKLAREGKLAREMRLAGGVTEGTPVSGALANFQQPQSTEQKTAARAFARERESARKSLRTPMEEFREAVTNASRLFSNEPVLYARAVAAARKDFTKEADEFRKKFRTPAEVFKEEMAKLSRAQMLGIISMEQFALGAKTIGDKFERDAGITKKRRDDARKAEKDEERRKKVVGRVTKFLRPEREEFKERFAEIAEATRGGLSLEDTKAAGFKSVLELARGLRDKKEGKDKEVSFAGTAGVNRAIQQSLRGGSDEELTQKEIKTAVELIAKDFPAFASSVTKNFPELVKKFGMSK